jgi:hypothetical protein
MIRPLRARHRMMITALAIALAVLFIAAIAVRKPAPIIPQLPAKLTQPGGGRP